MTFYRCFTLDHTPAPTDLIGYFTSAIISSTRISHYPWKRFAAQDRYLMIYHGRYEFLTPFTGTELIAAVNVSGLSRFFSSREGQLSLPSGETVLRGEQDWILYDRRTQALTLWDKTWLDSWGKWHDIPSILPPPSRTKGPFHTITSGIVSADAIDNNNHVNNNIYLQWILDSLDTKTPLHTWSITYHRELRLGDPYTIEVCEEDKRIHHRIYGPEHQLAFRSTIAFKS